MKTRIEKGEDVKVEICEHCDMEYPFDDGSASGSFHKCKACGQEGCEECMAYIRVHGSKMATDNIWYHRVCKEKFFDMTLEEVMEGETE